MPPARIPLPPSPHAGSNPYRAAPLTPPSPPAVPRAVLGGGSVVLALLCVARAMFAPTKPPVIGSDAPPLIENATSLAGGPRITAVFTDRDARRRAVLRVPGAAMQRGTDTVVAPEVIAAHGAVAAAPDGEHLVDEHGELLRVLDGVVAPLPGVEVAPFPLGELLPQGARVVQRAGAFARMDNGALHAFRGAGHTRPELADRWLVRDVATDGAVVCALGRNDRVRCAYSQHWEAPTGPSTPDTWAHPVWVDVEPLAGHGAEQVVTGGGVACVREAGGGVFCTRLSLPRRGEEMAQRFQNNVPLPLTGDAPRATAVAIGRDDLCVLGVDGHLSCVHGPQEDAFAPVADAPLRLRDVMDGVTEVALTKDLGCARRGGRIVCWGPLARGGWVTRRERPVRVAGLRDVSSLATSDGLVCALTRGSAWCWGTGSDGMRRPTPVRVELPAPADRIERTVRHGVCATLEGSRTRCWRDVGARAVYEPELAWIRPAEPPAPADPPELPGLLVWGNDYACRAADGGVACGARIDRGDDAPPLRRVEGIDDVAQVVVAGGLACARTRTGDVWCWGDNASGALTVAEAERAPRLVTLRR